MTIVDQLKRDEGLRLTAYKDSLGKTTIGYGRCLETEGITRDEAEYLLHNDVLRVCAALDAALPWMRNLDDARRAVLQNMGFNMGLAGLLGFRNTLALIQAGEYDKAADAMLQSRWAEQVGARAQRLSQQMRTGQWV
jgi:lysozyme